MRTWILDNVAYFIGLGGSALTYLVSRRHFQKKELKQAEVILESSTAEVIGKNLSIYQQMLDDLEKRYKARIDSYEKDIERLMEKIHEMKREHDREKESFKAQILELKKMAQ